MTSRKTSLDSTQNNPVENQNDKREDSKIQIINVNELPNEEKQEIIPQPLMIRLEHRFTMSDLEELKAAFQANNSKKSKGIELTKYEFASFISSVVNKGEKHEYDELFDNIDVTKNGKVNWDTFSSYILLMLYENDDKAKKQFTPAWKPIKNIQNQHRESIRRITYVKNLNCYISISKEGSCCVYDNNVNLTSNTKASSNSCKSRDLWVTDFTILPNVNKIGLAFTTKEIEIYDCSKLDFNCQFRITGLPSIALALDYWFDENNDNDAILIWGDKGGYIHSIHFNSAKIALFERPSTASSESDNQETCLEVKIDDIKEKYKNATYVVYKGHSGWVRQVRWASKLECIISCCGTDKGSVNLGWFEKTNTQMRIPYKRADYKFTTESDYYYMNLAKPNINSNIDNNNVNTNNNEDETKTNSTNDNYNSYNILPIQIPESVKNSTRGDNNKEGRNTFSVPIRNYIKSSQFDVSNGGVLAFDYEEKLNLIATANGNNNVHLYNPYVQDANGILKGHMKSVIAVKFIAGGARLVSFSKDKVLRIWNVNLQMGIYRIANIYPKGPEVDITFYFDTEHLRVFTSFRNLLLMQEIKADITDRVMTHDKPVVASRLNRANNQVFTLSQDGTLIIWLIENGQKLKTFTDLHGIAEVTCMEFDELNTKFYTGGTDGNIKIWDFNGHCYYTLDASNGGSCEITQILGIKRRIITVGWSKEITVFRDSMFRDHKVKTSEWKGLGEHEEDILCAAIMKNQPMQMVTASFDGDIVVWNSVTELASKHLTARKRVSNKNVELMKKDITGHSIKSDKIRHISSKNISSSSKPQPQKQPKLQSEVTIDPENDFSFAITCLRYLQTRSPIKDSTLVSCGGNGWLRFWDITNSEVIAEFIAHIQVSSIIMEVDPDGENYLATGDVNGIIKIWNIENYCRNLHLRKSKTVDTYPPPLVTTIKAHADVINSISFCHLDESILVITGSSDCSVSLHNILGTKIGVFGQPDLWKLKPAKQFNDLIQDTKEFKAKETNEENNGIKREDDKMIWIDKSSEIETKKNIFANKSQNEFDIPGFTTSADFGLVKKLNSNLKFEETYTFDKEAFVKNPSLRYNPWSKTILGRTYQEARIKKRDRKQPGCIATDELMFWEKTGQTAGGIYGALQTADLVPASELKEPKKPDFIKNPHRYFRDRSAVKLSDLEKPIPSLAETLNSAFDEYNLFPKYILNYEARMKQEHKKILETSGNAILDTSHRRKRNSISSSHN